MSDIFYPGDGCSMWLYVPCEVRRATDGPRVAVVRTTGPPPLHVTYATGQALHSTMPKWDGELFSRLQAVPHSSTGPQAPGWGRPPKKWEGPIPSDCGLPSWALGDCNHENVQRNARTRVIACWLNRKSTRVTRALQGPLYPSAAALAAVQYFIRPAK